MELNNQMAKHDTESYGRSQRTWCDEFREFIEACMEADCSNEI